MTGKRALIQKGWSIGGHAPLTGARVLWAMGVVWVAGCSTAASPATPVPPIATATTVPATAAVKPAAVAATAPSKPAATPKPEAKPTAAVSAGSDAACVVGDWVVTNVTITDAVGQQSGGAGGQWEISSTGALKVTLDGSKPILGSNGGGIQLGGSYASTIQVPQDAGASSGQWVASNTDTSQQTTSVIGPDGKTLTTIAGNKVLGPNGNVLATVGPSNAVDTGSTWTCAGNTLTVQVNGATARGTGQTVTTLMRRTP